MTAYGINKVCHLVEKDPAFRERFRVDVESAVAGFKLDPDEVEALKSGDVVTLFRRGGHPFLLQNLGAHRLCGLDRDSYRERITSLARG